MKVIVGCGNLVRKDDGAGPILIRKLWDIGVPDHVRLADGGTAGMDVAFQIKGAKELFIVDACSTGATPGTLFEIPGKEVEAPPLTDINLHNFRWDHAIAMGRWLWKKNFPKKVTVFLIEVEDSSHGFGLTSQVDKTVSSLATLLIERVAGENNEL